MVFALNIFLHSISEKHQNGFSVIATLPEMGSDQYPGAWTTSTPNSQE